MTIKGLHIEILTFYTQIEDYVALIESHWPEEVKLNHIFESIPPMYFIHPKLLQLFTDFLQIVDIEENTNQVSLEEISCLQRLNLKLLPKELSQYSDIGRFLDTVLGNEKEGYEILSHGIDIAHESIDALKKELQNLQ